MVELIWNAPTAQTGTIFFRYYYHTYNQRCLNSSYVYAYRYAFVDTFSFFWANQATDTIDEGKSVKLLTNTEICGCILAYGHY